MGGGQGGPKNSLTKGSGPSNLVDNVRGGLGDHVTSLVLGNWRWKRRGRPSQQAEVRWDRSDIQSRKPFRNSLHQSLASGGWNTCLRFVHHLVRVVTMLWTLASLAYFIHDFWWFDGGFSLTSACITRLISCMFGKTLSLCFVCLVLLCCRMVKRRRVHSFVQRTSSQQKANKGFPSGVFPPYHHFLTLGIPESFEDLSFVEKS